MRRNLDYHALSGSKEVLIAEADVIYALLGMGRMNLITDIYQDVYTTPDIYAECRKTLDVDRLKVFNSTIREMEFSASKMAVVSIMDQSPILTESDGFAMLCGMMKKTDVVLDDPRKAKMFSSHSVHVVRLSDIISAVAVTKK